MIPNYYQDVRGWKVGPNHSCLRIVAKDNGVKSYTIPEDKFAKLNEIVKDKSKLETLAKTLIEKETMDGREVEELLKDKVEGEGEQWNG